MALNSDYLPVDDGIGPYGNSDVPFYVLKTVIRELQDDGPEWKYEDARFLKEAIQQPDVIFGDLKRNGENDSFAYSVRLTHDPHEENPFPPAFGRVFLVFVRLGQGGYLIFDWEWREEDADHPGFPIGFGQDFGSPTWKKT